ncbi:MAG: Stk1 family PASTA domain-containing Ser/Thr kinase [Anaerovoracaceae bacterium]|jgi:serine/threonine protein kinase/beta-lactam-binding protein with PASTA domain
MGTRLLAGRYELFEKIGDGGMAVVYKAKDRLLNRYVAIKILKPEFTKDIKFIENFRRESQAAASLSHPNIVNVYDIGKEGYINYIVMELIEGEVLADVIKTRGPMEVEEAIGIALQIGAALSHAHKNHIIHRDVKPHNVLLTSDGTAKITDFGIAKAVDAATIVSKTGTVMGSVHYFSPEQARGGYVDDKSDIYSLGIVMYEMLTGKVPFDADNPVTVAVMHMNDEMIPPSKIVKGIPALIEEVILKATQKYQVNRFKSVDEMLEVLKGINLDAMENMEKREIVENRDLQATIVMEAIKSNREPKQNAETFEDVDEGASFLDEVPEVRDDFFSAEKYEHEAGGGKVKPVKMEKRARKGKRNIDKVKLLAIGLAIILAIPASQLVLHFVDGGVGGKEVKVPDLLGMKVEEAETLLDELGLKLEIDKEVFSPTYDEGEIASQKPLDGMEIKKGQSVKVNVSKGMEEGMVPDVTGKTLDTAKREIEDAGFNVGMVTEDFSTKPEGIIIRQTPNPGDKAREGDRINLVISKGEEIKMTTVPSLKGLALDKAKNEIENANLTLGGTIKYEYSNSVEANLVISQNPGAGSTVNEKTPVMLTVSKGPEPAPEPRTVNIKVTYDAAPDEVFYLTVVVSDNSGVGTPINYEQRLKSNGSETLSITGEGRGSVKILFNNSLVKEYSIDFTTGAIH